VLLALLLAVVGLAVMTWAADHLVIGSSRLATRLRITPVVVGVAVIGLGTSAPEFLVSGVASAHGDAALALGNLTGSNIINLTLVLGLAALVRPVPVSRSVLRLEAPFTVAALQTFAVAIAIGLGLWWGVALAALMVATLVVLVRLSHGRASALPVPNPSTITDHRLGAESLRAVLGLAGVLIGAQVLVTNAVRIATTLGVSQALIGFTLVAAGTSLPEVVTAIQAQRRRESDLLVGNLLGSDLFNSLGGGAIVGLFSTQASGGQIGAGVLVVMVAVGLITWIVITIGRQVTRLEGILLLAIYVATLPLLV
jgi:cation:H+ antiporter